MLKMFNSLHLSPKNIDNGLLLDQYFWMEKFVKNEKNENYDQSILISTSY